MCLDGLVYTIFNVENLPISDQEELLKLIEELEEADVVLTTYSIVESEYLLRRIYMSYP